MRAFYAWSGLFSQTRANALFKKHTVFLWSWIYDVNQPLEQITSRNMFLLATKRVSLKPSASENFLNNLSSNPIKDVKLETWRSRFWRLILTYPGTCVFLHVILHDFFNEIGLIFFTSWRRFQIAHCFHANTSCNLDFLNKNNWH